MINSFTKISIQRGHYFLFLSRIVLYVSERAKKKRRIVQRKKIERPKISGRSEYRLKHHSVDLLENDRRICPLPLVITKKRTVQTCFIMTHSWEPLTLRLMTPWDHLRVRREKLTDPYSCESISEPLFSPSRLAKLRKR